MHTKLIKESRAISFRCCYFRYNICFLLLFFSFNASGQFIDTSKYQIIVEASEEYNPLFTRSRQWLGADGASSIDLGDGKVLWLFSDGFICMDSSGRRENSTIIRNSVALQSGYDLKHASLQFYWRQDNGQARAFFEAGENGWYWVGHGAMIKDRLIIFLIRERSSKTGLGFEAVGWAAVMVFNPREMPGRWKMKYLRVPETFGTIAGSAAVLKDNHYIYAFGAVEPDSHEVYLLRWRTEDVYAGKLKNPQWWFTGKWGQRKFREKIPESLFTGATEYSVHYDSALRKYVQVQSIGFGKAAIALRMADSIQGKWSDPRILYTPDYSENSQPLMYAARAHPELRGNGLYITYNLNSLDWRELIANRKIYYPRFIKVLITAR